MRGDRALLRRAGRDHLQPIIWDPSQQGWESSQPGWERVARLVRAANALAKFLRGQKLSGEGRALLEELEASLYPDQPDRVCKVCGTPLVCPSCSTVPHGTVEQESIPPGGLSGGGLNHILPPLAGGREDVCGEGREGHAGGERQT